VAIIFDTERQRLNSPECYHNSISAELKPKRDKMAKFLEEVGMIPTIPEGGYFMVADFSNLSKFITTLEFTSRLKYFSLIFFSNVLWRKKCRFERDKKLLKRFKLLKI